VLTEAIVRQTAIGRPPGRALPCSRSPSRLRTATASAFRAHGGARREAGQPGVPRRGGPALRPDRPPRRRGRGPWPPTRRAARGTRCSPPALTLPRPAACATTRSSASSWPLTRPSSPTAASCTSCSCTSSAARSTACSPAAAAPRRVSPAREPGAARRWLRPSGGGWPVRPAGDPAQARLLLWLREDCAVRALRVLRRRVLRVLLRQLRLTRATRSGHEGGRPSLVPGRRPVTRRERACPRRRPSCRETSRAGVAGLLGRAEGGAASSRTRADRCALVAVVSQVASTPSMAMATIWSKSQFQAPAQVAYSRARSRSVSAWVVGVDRDQDARVAQRGQRVAADRGEGVGDDHVGGRAHRQRDAAGPRRT